MFRADTNHGVGGRGLIQLTHKESYREFTEWYNKNYADDPQNFVDNPDLLNQPKYATLSALWEFCVDKNKSKNPNNRIFDSVDEDDEDSIDNVTRLVNGPKKNGLVTRKDILKKSKNVLSENK